MAFDWKSTELMCSNCLRIAYLRYFPGRAQFDNGMRWVEIAKSAEIIMCNHCGTSIYISSVKALAEL